ncbi:MAG: hypothetical protein MUF71_20205 [Candidatus Kapabacteria bacterium]|jgi:hypothetical protein|nr:hypothetical protein [Candidatus Kapabacteria bacterium]
MDAITQEIVSHLEHLPIEKKLAVLELVKPNANNGHSRKQTREERLQWLLSFREYDNDALNALEEVHQWANSWEEPRYD